MRFRGGGVGHRATRERTEPMSQEADTMVPNNGNDDELFGDGEQQSDEEGSESDSSEGSDRDGAEEEAEVGEEAGGQDDFDGEDGEEPWEVDEYMAEGYAAP